MLATLKAIATIIKNLGQFLEMIFNAIVSFFTQLGYFYSALQKVLSIVNSLVEYLPDWLRVFATLSLVIIIIYQILGRENGGA